MQEWGDLLDQFKQQPSEAAWRGLFSCKTTLTGVLVIPRINPRLHQNHCLQMSGQDFLRRDGFDTNGCVQGYVNSDGALVGPGYME